MIRFIDIQTQYRLYKEEIDRAIQNVLDSGAFILGQEVSELEEQLAAYVGVSHCIGVASGTDSLVMALMALDVGPGDEVITSPFTFVATAQAIALVGATPVFVDVDQESFTLDVAKLKSAITPKTKAVMPVSLFGQMANLSAINAVAEPLGIAVIEDGAQSFGATHLGKRSCGMTTIGSTSFFPTKPFACCGDGGALFTDDPVLAEKMRAIRTHGSLQRDHYPILGINGRLDTIQAAVLLAKLPHFAQELRQREAIGRRYTEGLQNYCVTPSTAEGNCHSFALYTIRNQRRDQLRVALDEMGIPTAVYYPKGLHEQPAFANLGYQYGDFPVVEQLCREVISLPMHPWLTEEEQDLVIAAVVEATDRVAV